MATMHQIGKTATVIGNDGYMNYVQYHETQVVRWNDRQIILNSDGWRTATTKNRMNQTSNQFNLGFRVYQQNFDWYVTFKGKTWEWYDEMKLDR